MPQIIVTTDRGAAFGEGAVTLRERVNVSDFESAHFAAQLVERLGWAVDDAEKAERARPAPTPARGPSASASPPQPAREPSASASSPQSAREPSAEAAREPAAAR